VRRRAWWGGEGARGGGVTPPNGGPLSPSWGGWAGGAGAAARVVAARANAIPRPSGARRCSRPLPATCSIGGAAWPRLRKLIVLSLRLERPIGRFCVIVVQAVVKPVALGA